MWLLLLGFCAVARAQYEVPEALVEVFQPKGFRVSIPDEEGIKLFAFHGKINEELEGREGGTFSRDIIKPKNGRWIFEDKITKLKKGDVIYYWTYVDYFDGRNKLGYTRDDQKYVVDTLLTREPGAGPGPMPGSTGCGSNCQKLFEDDFNGDIRSNRNWNIEQRYADKPDFEFNMYMDRPEILSVNNGVLRIKPAESEDIFWKGFVKSREGFDFKESCTGVPGTRTCTRKFNAGFILPSVVSSQISTKNKFSFKYGTVEIRARLPKGDWIYPELYLNPVFESYGQYYESGQIRIAFVEGNPATNNVLQGGVVLGDSPAARSYGMKTFEQPGLWSDDFHTYAVKWTPDSITMLVDNRTYGTIYPPGGGFHNLANELRIDTSRWRTGSKMAPFDQDMYITLGVGVGGVNFKDRSDDSKPWTNRERNSEEIFYRKREEWGRTWSDKSAMEVDYVKVYAN